jgi:hypothetical protein
MASKRIEEIVSLSMWKDPSSSPFLADPAPVADLESRDNWSKRYRQEQIPFDTLSKCRRLTFHIPRYSQPHNQFAEKSATERVADNPEAKGNDPKHKCQILIYSPKSCVDAESTHY